MEEGPGTLERARRAVRASGERLEASRDQHPVVDALLQVVSRDKHLVGGLLASAVAFRLFLWIVPMALVFVAGFGFYSAADPARAQEYAREYGISAFITGSVSRALQASDRGRWVALVVGLVALVWSSRSLAVSMRAVHALAWDVRPVPAIRWSAKAVLIVAGLMTGAVLVLPMVSWLRDRSTVLGIVGIVGSVLVVAGFWTLASALMPRREDVPVSALVPGGLLVGTVLELLHAVSVFYLPGRFDRASTTYGGLGMIVVALAWLYFSGRAVVAAAVLDVTLWERRGHGTPDVRDDGGADPDQGKDDRP